MVEEKVDGTGVSIFFDDDLSLKIWHRGSPATGKEFNRLYDWADAHHDQLFDLLDQRFILFGEWMYLKHSIFYDNLPSYDGYAAYPYYFLESDMFDKRGHIWLATSGRQALLSNYPFIKSVPILKSFRPQTLKEVTSLIDKSAFQTNRWGDILETKVALATHLDLDMEQVLKETDQSSLMEGLYIKHENDRHVVGRYKYVRHEFVQTIIKSGTHYKDRTMIANTYSVK